ncbi:urease accessory protein UreF [Myroides sp. LJL119]
MKNQFLGKLLHLSDPTLPIGGYTHSNGLETYVQKGIVCDKQSAKSYVKHNLWYNIKYNDAALMKLAFDAAKIGDFQRIIDLDLECNALKAPMEVRVGSQKLGLRLFKIFSRYYDLPLVEQLQKALDQKDIYGHYCIVYGVFAYLMELPIVEAMHAYYYNATISMVTNAVKLVPLGQLDGQDILYDLHQEIWTLSQESLNLDPSLIGMCNIGFDIRCMQHEHLYSRLYLS